jgi:TolB-like protein
MAMTVAVSGGTNRRREADPDEREVREELARILASPDFNAPDRNRRFLAHVVEETLRGRGSHIRAYTIAVMVFDRDDSFDPRTDPIVRIEASRLRRSLERFYLLAGKDHGVRIGIPRGGYVPVFVPQGNGAPPREAAPPAQGSPPAPPREAGAAPPPRRERVSVPPLAAAALAILIAMAFAAAALMGGRFRDTPVAAGPPVQDRPALLVAPFEDLGGDTDHFADGMALEVISNLVRFKELVVFDARVSREAGDADPLALGRRLGADYVVMGTVLRDGAGVHVTAQLVELAGGASIWAATYGEELAVDSLMDIQDRIAAAVAAAIAQPYGVVYGDVSGRVRRSRPDDLGAYECLLEAYAYRRRIDRQEHAHVRACLEGAIAREGDHAEAKAMLSMIYLDEFRFGLNPRPDLYDPLERAFAVAKNAAALAPDNALAQLALEEAHFFLGELEEARAAGERAVLLNPNHSEPRAMLGLRLAHSGEWERGLALVREAIAMNPAPPGWYYIPLAIDAVRRGNEEEGLAWMAKADMPEFFWTHAIRAAILGRLGRLDEAGRAIESLREVYPGFGMDEARLELGRQQMEAPVRDLLLDGLEAAGLAGPAS